MATVRAGWPGGGPGLSRARRPRQRQSRAGLPAGETERRGAGRGAGPGRAGRGLAVLARLPACVCTCVCCARSEPCAETGEQPLTDENDVYGLIFCPESQPAVPPWSFAFVLFTALLLFPLANCTVLYFANLLFPSYFCSIVPVVQIDLQVLPMCTARQVRISGLMIAAGHRSRGWGCTRC